jgi:hypothetical protein
VSGVPLTAVTIRRTQTSGNNCKKCDDSVSLCPLTVHFRLKFWGGRSENALNWGSVIGWRFSDYVDTCLDSMCV